MCVSLRRERHSGGGAGNHPAPAPRPRCSPSAVSFKLYDQDCDNRISKAELTQMLMATLVESDLTLTPDQARRLVDRTMDAARTSEPGYVNLDEYRRLIEGSPGLMNDMTLNVHARIREEIANAKRDRAGK